MGDEIRPANAGGFGGRSSWGERAPVGRCRRLVRRVLPLAALGGIVVVDLILARRPWPLLLDGTLDEVGHLLTAALLLAVLPRSARGRLWPWALLGAVAIDVDHIPLYTFAPEFDVGGRPPTHSLLTVLILALVAAVIPAVRIPFAGLAIGVCLHFVRDVATGPGVPLFWPAEGGAVRLPYAAYLVVMAAAAGVATWKVARATHPRADPPRAASDAEPVLPG
jgi:inner membrane protein